MGSHRLGNSRWGAVLRNTGFLAVATAFSSLAQFGLVWYIARSRGAVFLGAYGLTGTLLEVFQRVLAAGIQPLVMREVARGSAPRSSFIGTTAVASVCTGTCAALVLAAWPFVLGYSPGITRAILVGCLSLIPGTLGLVGEFIAIALERTRFVMAVRLAQGGLQALLVTTVLVLGEGLTTVFAVVVVVYVGVAFTYLYLVREWLGPEPMHTSLREIKRWLVSWRPFFGFGFFSTSARQLDIVILNQVSGLNASGLYTAASKLLRPMVLLRPVAFQAFFPTFVRSLDSAREQGLQMIQDAMRVLATVLSALALVASGAAYAVIVLLYQEEFTQSVPVLRILVWILPLLYIQSLLGGALFAEDAEDKVARAHAICFPIGLISHTGLAAVWGPVGTAIASLGVRMVTVGQLWVILKKRWPSPSFWKTYAGPTVLALSISLVVVLATDKAPMLVQCLAAVLAGLVYLFLALGLGFISVRDWTSLVGVVQHLVYSRRRSTTPVYGAPASDCGHDTTCTSDEA